jgi:hypothetical protein
MNEVYEVELCRVGSSTDRPCPNLATVEDELGAKVCEAHRRVFELRREADGYCLAEEFLDEAIEKLKGLEIFGEAGIPLLEKARAEAIAEHQRVKREMDALDPLKA